MRGGEVIARARRWSGLSAEELADRLDVPLATVEEWERGDPQFSVVQQAVEACEQSIDRVVTERDLDPHDRSLIQQSIRLTIEQRFDSLMNAVRFIEAGRKAVQAAR
jgi:ribosome-binding protein aMBF1 (putative translation factor)